MIRMALVLADLERVVTVWAVHYIDPIVTNLLRFVYGTANDHVHLLQANMCRIHPRSCG